MDDNEYTEAKDDADSDYVIDSIENNEKSLVFGIYSKIRSYQFHYNTVKTHYKALSLTWLLATFIALGYLLTGKEIGLPMDKIIATGLLSIFSASGIFLLFFLDVIIYHRLVEALFVGTLNLEKKYPFLTNTNQNIAKLLIKGSIGPVVYDGLFYAYFIFILLLISDASFVYYFYENNEILSMVSGFVYLIIIVVISLMILNSAKESGLKRLFKGKKYR